MARNTMYITKELEKKFLANPLYSHDGEGLNAKIIAKFFLPGTDCTWLITEAKKEENGDWTFYGYMKITEWEFGYVTYNEMKSVLLRGLFRIELDKYLEKGITIKDYLEKYTSNL